MPLLPPTPPNCPLCERSIASFVRQHDNYPQAFGGLPGPPTSTVFIFQCNCGCSFAVTVPLEQRRETEVQDGRAKSYDELRS